jgi:superfamily II DNA or RNA helicase
VADHSEPFGGMLTAVLSELTPARIRAQFPASYFARGQEYQRAGKVVELDVDEERGSVCSRVEGSGGETYDVTVKMHGDARDLTVIGECTCPIGFNCKHVVAALLAAVQTDEEAELADPTGPRLRYELATWLDAVERASLPPAERSLYPPNVAHRLLYLLSLEDFGRGDAPVAVARLVTARTLKQGGYSAPSPYTALHNVVRGIPRFALQSDREIVIFAQSHLMIEDGSQISLSGRNGAHLIGRMVETGRCHWETLANPPLALGPARNGAGTWDYDAVGNQAFTLVTEPRSALVLALAPPWYVDVERASTGPIDTVFEPDVAAALAASPSVHPDEAVGFALELERRLGTDLVPPPQLPRQVVIHDAIPTPCLKLAAAPRALADYLRVRRYGGPGRAELALLEFDYCGERVADPHVGPIRSFRAGEIRTIERSQAHERQARQRLEAIGFRRCAPDDHPLRAAPSLGGWEQTNEEAWLRFMLTGLPQLRSEGWRIEIDPEFRYDIAQPTQWFADIDEQGDDWFDLELGIEVDGERVALAPLLLKILREAGDNAESLRQTPDDGLLLTRLDSGRLVGLPAARVRSILATLIELHRPDRPPTARLRLSRYEVAQLADLEAALSPTWAGGAKLRALGNRLRDFDSTKAYAPPAGFVGTLRRYQEYGVTWLQFLREQGLSGILADDMGLGKTVQTLAHLMIERASGRADRPSLIVAPTSLMHNWRSEAARFAPELRVLTLQGSDRKRDFRHIEAFDLVLTTYPLLRRDEEILTTTPWHVLILDEAQNIKNAGSQAARVASRLEARHRLCLTGTPLENHLGELWSLFHFLMPGFLGDAQQFAKFFRTPIERRGEVERRTQLARRVKPFLLRRTKEEVASELPPKTEIIERVELSGAQRDLYETLRVTMHERVRAEVARAGLERSRIVILDALLKLRQVCCDPRLVRLAQAPRGAGSAKLALLMDLLPSMLVEGRSVLIFSQFVSMLELVEPELRRSGIEFVKLTGDTQDRVTPIEKFQSGAIRVFLLSLKAGGVGLNLTAADTVIHYDPWWNPAVERQATDRAHRYGQTRPVFVYKLIVAGSVEEKIVALQARKAALAEGILDGSGDAPLDLSPEDLDALFAPIST